MSRNIRQIQSLADVRQIQVDIMHKRNGFLLWKTISFIVKKIELEINTSDVLKKNLRNAKINPQ